MTENTVSRLWFMRTMFILLSVGVIFLHLLPLSTLPGTLAAPDIILALAFCWALRRPEFVPALHNCETRLFQSNGSQPQWPLPRSSLAIDLF